MTDQLKPHLYLGFATLIGAFNYSLLKMLIPDYLTPGAAILLRVICGSVFFGILCIISKEPAIEKKDIVRMIFAAAFGIAGNQLLFFKGLSLTSPIDASLMMTSAPVIILVISIISKKEQFTLQKFIGILLACSGAFSLLLHTGQDMGKSSITGDLLILLNSTCWALFLISVKPLALKYPTLLLATLLFSFGGLIVVPFGYQDLHSVDFMLFNHKIWLLIFYMIIFSTILSYYFNIKVLKYVDPSIAGVYIYLQPLLATVIAISVGQDQLSVEKILYATLILAGIFLVGRKAKIISRLPASFNDKKN